MPKIITRKGGGVRIPTSEIAKDVQEVIEDPDKMDDGSFYTPSDSDIFVSSGSTLLDLAISGSRVRGGGIPGGIMMELFGPSATGKTALAMEIAASVQDKGGEVLVADPEARLDFSYAKTYGTELDSDYYWRPDTVLDNYSDSGKLIDLGLEGIIKDEWRPERKDVINVLVADSIAALSTNMEMDKGDKRGQKKAKDLHALCRTTARLISKDNRLLVFTNQLTAGEWGEESPGGVAIKFYASLRIQLRMKEKIVKVRKNKAGKDVKKIIGIESEAFIKKSSVDDPYRTAPIYLLFGFGIDDVRANLQYAKDMKKATKYECGDGKTYVGLDDAIKYVESNELESVIRDEVIDLWEEAETLFQSKRKRKVRF